MKHRELTVYISLGFIASSLILALYFFSHKPRKIAAPNLEEASKGIVLKDVRYSGEKRGIVDWEIKAKTAKKFIDKPEIEMDTIEGEYKPNAGVLVFFKGTKGVLDTNEEKGNIEDVVILYNNDYTLKTRYMAFDFKKKTAFTSSPVDIESSRLTLKGIGLNANTQEETVRLEKDISGSIATDKGRYRFESERFLYRFSDSTYILDGSVIMKGQDMNLVCDTLYVFSKGKDPERIDAKGRVRLISKGTIAKSENAVYHLKEDRIVLTGAPKIFKDKVEMEGETIVYDLSSGRFSIDKSRVRLEK